MTEYVLVTGAARNIGRAIAERCKADGYKVLLLDIIEPEDPTIGEYLHADLSNPESTAAALAKAAQGRAVTRLVNCAGLLNIATIEDTKAADFDRLMAVNVRSYIQVFQSVLPAMRAAKFGRVVNIASRAALGAPLQTIYSATKGAVVSMTRVWALEEAANGITINAIGPGPVETAMYASAYPPGSEKRATYLKSIPMQRAGEPAEIAHAASHMLDARSGYMTGQVVYVCGGSSLGRSLV